MIYLNGFPRPRGVGDSLHSFRAEVLFWGCLAGCCYGYPALIARDEQRITRNRMAPIRAEIARTQDADE